MGHAEKSRAVPKEGNKLKSGAGQSVLHLGHFKKEFQKMTIWSRLDVAQQTAHTAGSVCHFVDPGSLISKCSCGAKNGGLFAEVFMSVAQGKSAADSGFIQTGT